MDYGTASHLCACGCGEKVVTPFGRQFWKLTYDGESVSLRPSIGNWSYQCRSHYWIKNNRIEWDRTYNEAEIKSVRNEQQSENQQFNDQLKQKPKPVVGLFNQLRKAVGL
ncbi:MAG: DUF6527 family protein [Flavobacteriales bacterium]